MRRLLWFIVLVLILITGSILAQEADTNSGRLILVTTTSPYDSGLLNYIIPNFE